MSAGTIWCMSGDNIFMNYSSSLGPIDPQVLKGNEFVPALGYLDKVDELVEKSRAGTLTNAEFAILQNQDLAMLSAYEQAKELTIALLKNWLVNYKFKNWHTHRTDPLKKGQVVTLQEKEARAGEIAEALSDNTKWHTHGRFIDIKTLRSLRLEIEDYSQNPALQKHIDEYAELVRNFIEQKGIPFFIHHRDHF
jgi:hypothetical protein